jgi:RHS repeat-associated protein
MKRFLSALFAGSCCLSIIHASDEPPVEESPGWMSPGFTEWSVSTGYESLGMPDPATSSPPLAEALSASPGEELAAQAFDLGLPHSVTPSAGDLLLETARGLDCNWAQCYLFVRNQIRFIPCKGISRGPERTLLDREGSAGDQAFLLLALLRAAGYADAKMLYISNNAGGFRIPLAGAASGFDAASWIGVATNGTVDDVFSAVTKPLGASMLDGTGVIGPTLETSAIWIEHFWLRLTLNGASYDLDPSFKPRLITPPSGSILTDMGYTRTNLLTQAGGTTNAYYVQGLSGAALSAELRRLSANLAAKWREAGTEASARDFIGGDSIVPQDFGSEANTFHGTLGGTAVDFLAQSDSYKNAFRYSLKLEHCGFTNTFWLDEVGARHLWLSYTNATGYAHPRAVLHLDDTVLATEPAGAVQAADKLYITVSHPFALDAYKCTYSISNAAANVYAIPVGFGDRRGGMRERAQSEFDRVHSSGVSASNAGLRSRVLQVVGQQWLAQTAMQNELRNRLDGSDTHFFYNIGLAAQTTSPYVDLKNCLYYTSSDTAKFNTYSLFASALEHAALDQVNGTNRPAVSTVRVIDLANAANTAIYFATAGNWTTVRGSLINYDNAVLDKLAESINVSNHKVLLPKNGHVTLNNWTSYGYIDYGPQGGGYSMGMMIGNGLSGGFGSVPYVTPPAAVSYQYSGLSLPSISVPSYSIADPVDALSGAFLSDQPDLSLPGPVPLSVSRHYDSRLRRTDGPFGKGWSHGYDVHVNVHADPDAFIAGRGLPASMAASVVACTVANDLIASGENAKSMATACLVVKWWSDQLVVGAASVKMGGSSLAFTRSPDGSYLPVPGVTATLVRSNNTAFVLSERLGPVWRFNSLDNLDRVDDPSGNFTRLYYNSQTNLVAVSNTFGGKLTFAWSGSHVSNVVDSAGRSVAYSYSPSGCLTSVTDSAGFVWKSSYGTDDALLSETDPGGVVSIRNAYNALGQVTNQLSAAGHLSTFAFAAGTSTIQRDPVGGRSLSAFDSDGRLVRRTGPDGGITSVFYDTQGQSVTNVDTRGRARVSVYDASNRLVRVTEAANKTDARTTSFAYDVRHRLVAVTNALGSVTRMSYDACDRLASKATPDGVTVTNVYDAHGLVISSRTLDASGRVLSETSSTYDARGFATQVISTDAGTSLFGYDLAGNVTNVTDALGRSTRFFYDKCGLATNTVNALGGRTTRVYNSARRLISSENPLNRLTAFFWTPGGQLAATRYADGGISTNEYDAADRLVASSDPRGGRVTLGLDLMGRVTNRCGQAWQERAWYDSSGLATARVDAVSGRTSVGYDWLDRPVDVKDTMGHARSSAYDALGSVTGTTDPRGRATAYAYDLAGRRTWTGYPSGRAEASAYDALGRMVAFTNAEGRVCRMGYDAQGRLLAATNAAGEQVVRNLYDLVGNLTNRTDGAGRSTRYRYDALNRGTNTVYSDGAFEAFTYDGAGNLLAAGNGSATNSFAYDAMNRLTSSVSRASGQTFAVKYGYDLGGLATNVVYPDGKAVRYGYDADGRVVNVTDWVGRSFTFTRDAAGRMTALTYPNGRSGAWQYDANHAVSSWSYGTDGSPFVGRTITRDDAGVKVEEHVITGLFPNPPAARRAVNTFDSADRLVSAAVTSGTNTFGETYHYDATGSLTNVTRSAGGTSPQAYSYDLAGRLVSAVSSNLSLAVTYDALGNRLRTVSGGVTRLWVTDHADLLKRPLMETDTAGVPVRYYVWGGGLLLAVVEADGVVRYAHSDEQGSVIALTDASGAVTDQYCYGPYGADWGHTGTNALPFLWLGSHGVCNVVGGPLYMTRHRLYSAALYRFLSADPTGLGGGPNLYAYCMGNPLAYIDPQGLAISAASIGAAQAFDTAWNFGVQFATFNPNATPQMQDAMYQANLSTFGSPMQQLFGAYDTPASQPIMVAPEIVSAAWEAGAVSAGLPNVGAQSPTPSIASFAENLRPTQTVASHEASRPYIQSSLTAAEIMSARPPVADPQGVPNVLRWDVPGSFNGSSGAWEFVIDPSQNLILHWNFISH